MFENVSVVAKQPNQSASYGIGLENTRKIFDKKNSDDDFKVVDMPSLISDVNQNQDHTIDDNNINRKNFKENGFLKLPETQEQAIALARLLSTSSLLSENIRSTNAVDHTADVFIIISLGCSLGMSAAQALKQIFVIKNRLGLYVSAKAGICYKHGSWNISLETVDGVPIAKASGYRFDRPTELKAVDFSALDARLKGKMTFNNGQWIGAGTWADKWPEMLKTRALGRLLDLLFPDVIGGYIDESFVEPDVEKTNIGDVNDEHNSDKTKSLLKKVKRQKETLEKVNPINTEVNEKENL